MRYKFYILVLLLILVGASVGCSWIDEQAGFETSTSSPIPSVTPSPTVTPTITTTKVPTVTGVLEVHYLDVGQGDCTLINYGEVEIVIDAGKNNSVYIPYLEERIDGKLELLVSTHPDADHIGDLDRILDTFEVAQIWDSGDTKTTDVYSDYWNAAINEATQISYPKRGQTLNIGNLKFLILNPEEGSDDDYNSNSIALMLTFGETTFYFMADVEESAEEEILEYFDTLPHATYLKAGHHGSKTSSSGVFLDEIEPSYVIYSAGRDNTYGHPHEEAIQRWIDHGATYLGTDTSGHIVITSDGTSTSTISTQH